MTARQPDGANPKPVVLVLQDEPILAGIMRDFVEEAGCEAVVVRTAEAAVRTLEGRTDIRVVFADLDVRGSTTGLKLVAMRKPVISRYPRVKKAISSGAYFSPSLKKWYRFSALPRSAIDQQISSTGCSTFLSMTRSVRLMKTT